MKERSSKKCLYAAGISFARQITKLAEDCFAKTGMHPSLAFLLMLSVDEPGITTTKAAEILSLAPSTITRFADILEQKGYIIRDKSGKNSAMHATEAGIKMTSEITNAVSNLYQVFSERLGEDTANELAELLNIASEKFKQHKS